MAVCAPVFLLCFCNWDFDKVRQPKIALMICSIWCSSTLPGPSATMATSTAFAIRPHMASFSFSSLRTFSCNFLIAFSIPEVTPLSLLLVVLFFPFRFRVCPVFAGLPTNYVRLLVSLVALQSRPLLHLDLLVVYLLLSFWLGALLLRIGYCFRLLHSLQVRGRS